MLNPIACHPKIINLSTDVIPTHTHSQARSATNLPLLLPSHSWTVMIWNLQYFSQQFLPVAPLSCAPHLLPPLWKKAARSAFCLTPPCQVRLAWLWTPRFHILLNTLLVDAGFPHKAWRWDHTLEMWGLGRGPEEDGKKILEMRGAGSCFSVVVDRVEVVVALHFSTSSRLQSKEKIHKCSLRFPLKDKSSVSALLLSISDCCTSTCFLLSAGVYDIVFSGYSFN